jgi:hypothetical protein
VIKRQFGYTNTNLLVKNAAQMVTLFALSNLWMVPGHCWPAQERCACNAENGCWEVLATAEKTEMSG